MDGYRPAFFVTAALLVVSVGYQWWSRPTSPVEPEAASSAEASSTVDDDAKILDADLRAAQRDLLAARAELSKCQSQAWDMAADLMRGDVDPAEAGAGGRGDDFCAVSQKLLRKQWELGEPKARELLGKQLGTEGWIDNDMKWRLGRHRERFDLASRDEAALERGYKGIWHRHGDRMRELAADGDWDGVAETVRAFWREEDEMLGEVLRPEELAAFSQSEGGIRRSLLAMLAAYADRPWDDEALSW